MSAPALSSPSSIRRRGRRFLPTLLLGAAFIPLGSPAQPVISSPVSTPLVPPSLRPPATGASSVAIPTGSSARAPFSWGPLSAHPYLNERFIYSDGLQVGPGRPSNSFVNTLSPGFSIDIGKNWSASYGATWTVYTNKAFKESLGHAVNVAGTLPHKTWAATFGQSYSLSSAPLIETARQTDQETVSTQLGVSKTFSRKLSVQSSVSQNLQFVTGAPDNYSWTTEHALHYRLSARTSGGLGAVAGYTDMDPGANMAFVRPNAQIAWKPSDKLSFSASGGEEIRQVYSRGVPARSTPVFSVSGQYSPFKYTQLTLTAGRSVSPSVLRNQVNDSTNWNAGFSQRLLRHFSLSGNYGEQESGYSATNTRVTGGRKDKSYNYGLRLGTTFLRRGTIGFLYQGTHNGSNATGFGFDSTQVGVEAGYRY